MLRELPGKGRVEGRVWGAWPFRLPGGRLREGGVGTGRAKPEGGVCSGGVAFPASDTNRRRQWAERDRRRKGVPEAGRVFPSGRCRLWSGPRQSARGVPGAWSTGQAPPPEYGSELQSAVAEKGGSPRAEEVPRL